MLRTALLAFLVLAVPATFALADVPASPDQPGESELAEVETTSLLTPDPLGFIAEPIATSREALEESYGLSYGLALTFVWQGASDVVTGTNNLFSMSYDFDGAWVAFEDDQFGAGSVGWLVEGGTNIGQDNTEDLGANVGSILGVNDDLDTINQFALTELWYQHVFAGEQFIVTAGKIDPGVFYDENRMANDETAQFLATPLVNSLAVPLPGKGLGANVRWQATESVYVSAGFHDFVAIDYIEPFSSFRFDRLFWAGEAGYSGDVAGLGEGNYRFMAWHADSGEASGAGYSISIDQEIGATNIVPFLRWGQADTDVSAIKSAFTFGVGLEEPFGREEDLTAVAWTWADPSDESIREESIFEGFYRVQVTDSLQISPDVQFVVRPAGNPDKNFVVVAGLRAQLSF